MVLTSRVSFGRRVGKEHRCTRRHRSVSSNDARWPPTPSGLAINMVASRCSRRRALSSDRVGTPRMPPSLWSWVRRPYPALEASTPSRVALARCPVVGGCCPGRLLLPLRPPGGTSSRPAPARASFPLTELDLPDPLTPKARYSGAVERLAPTLPALRRGKADKPSLSLSTAHRLHRSP
jgi:hypothetical protein